MHKCMLAAGALVLAGAISQAQTAKPRRPSAPKPSTPTTPSRSSTSPGAGPVVVIDTTRGVMEMETYPDEAPKTVANFLALVKKGFYNGLRFHRVEKGFVIQAGDPLSRDFSKRDLWGQQGSGTPIGVAEVSPKRPHRLHAVGMAHAGNAAQADSQFYITLAPVSRLDGRYVVFGQVIGGMDVPARIQIGDVIRKMTVRPAAAAKKPTR